MTVGASRVVRGRIRCQQFLSGARSIGRAGSRKAQPKTKPFLPVRLDLTGEIGCSIIDCL